MFKDYSYRNPYSQTRYGYSVPKPRALPQKFPEDIECVLPSADPHKGAIFISNVQAASNPQTLARHNIRAVLTCAKGHDRNIPRSKLEMFQYFPLEDKETCSISPYLGKGSDFIAQALQRTNILVHCIAGVSRSVSIVLGYLIRDKGMTYEQAYSTVKARRKIICPNEGFIKQLKKYEKQCRSASPTKSATFIRQNQSKAPNAEVTPRKQAAGQRPFAEKYYNTVQYSKKFTHSYADVQNQQQNNNRKSAVKFARNLQISHPENIQYTPQKSRQTYDFAGSKNNSTYLPKSSTLIENSYAQAAKTPEKHEQLSHVQNYNNRSDYYKQMNKQLNDRIQAIHQKYEQQRESLLSGKAIGSASKSYGYQTAYKSRDMDVELREKLYSIRGYGQQAKEPRLLGLYQERYGRAPRYTGYSLYGNRYY